MRSVFDELKDLIDYIQEEYVKINSEWMLSSSTKVNLKKAQVSDIDIDGAIYQSITDYVQLLNDRRAERRWLQSGYQPLQR